MAPGWDKDVMHSTAEVYIYKNGVGEEDVMFASQETYPRRKV